MKKGDKVVCMFTQVGFIDKKTVYKDQIYTLTCDKYSNDLIKIEGFDSPWNITHGNGRIHFKSVDDQSNNLSNVLASKQNWEDWKISEIQKKELEVLRTKAN